MALAESSPEDSAGCDDLLDCHQHGFAFVDHLFIILTVVHRVSRGAKVIGPDQRISPLEALKAMTINVANQYVEQASKGALEAGYVVHLVILDRNPLKVVPMAIKEFKVIETIKEGKTIYTALKATAQTNLLQESAGILKHQLITPPIDVAPERSTICLPWIR